MSGRRWRVACVGAGYFARFHRDAWAAGVAGGYAAVVWLGRADGAPRPGVTGRAGALPVLFDVFDRVAALGQEPPDRRAGAILARAGMKVLVCEAGPGPGG